MANFSDIAKACAEREAAMTEEEREELRAKRKDTERRLAERHERMLAPIRAVEDALAPLRGIKSVLDQARIAEDSLASVRLAQSAVDVTDLSTIAMQLAESPVSEALRALNESPMTELTRTLGDNRFSGLAGTLDTSALLGGAPNLGKLIPMSRINFPELAGVDRLRGLTRDLGHSESFSRPISPDLFAPIRPSRDVDQDERFDNLTEVVVAQTEQVVELRKEVREVKDSASRDAHRERKRSIRIERTGARLQWWHMVVASFLSAVLGALATKFIVGG